MATTGLVIPVFLRPFLVFVLFFRSAKQTLAVTLQFMSRGLAS